MISRGALIPTVATARCVFVAIIKDSGTISIRSEEVQKRFNDYELL